MLDTFYPGILPGLRPQQCAQSDIATFNQIYDVAVSLSSECVKKKLDPEAGWSSAGRGALLAA